MLFGSDRARRFRRPARVRSIRCTGGRWFRRRTSAGSGRREKPGGPRNRPRADWARNRGSWFAGPPPSVRSRIPGQPGRRAEFGVHIAAGRNPLAYLESADFRPLRTPLRTSGEGRGHRASVVIGVDEPDAVQDLMAKLGRGLHGDLHASGSGNGPISVKADPRHLVRRLLRGLKPDELSSPAGLAISSVFHARRVSGDLGPPDHRSLIRRMTPRCSRRPVTPLLRNCQLHILIRLPAPPLRRIIRAAGGRTAHRRLILHRRGGAPCL